MFINKYGMINAHSLDIVSENTILFTLEYILLNPPDKSSMEKKLENFIADCETMPGLYNQQPGLTFGKDRYMSHDTLTAIVAYSHLKGYNYHKKIWNHLKSHWFTYDNITAKTNFSRIMHPRDILYYGYCAGNPICILLYPLLALFMIITCLQSYKVRNGNKILKTDGKLISWVRCKCSSLNLTMKSLTFLLKLNSQFGNWNNVFRIYFKELEHPIRKLLD